MVQTKFDIKKLRSCPAIIFEQKKIILYNILLLPYIQPNEIEITYVDNHRQRT